MALQVPEEPPTTSKQLRLELEEAIEDLYFLDPGTCAANIASITPSAMSLPNFMCHHIIPH